MARRARRATIFCIDPEPIKGSSLQVFFLLPPRLAPVTACHRNLCSQLGATILSQPGFATAAVSPDARNANAMFKVSTAAGIRAARQHAKDGSQKHVQHANEHGGNAQDLCRSYQASRHIGNQRRAELGAHPNADEHERQLDADVSRRGVPQCASAERPTWI